jgi:hypothetical protein
MGDNGQPAVGNAGPDERVSTAALLAAMELIRTEFRGINGGGCRLARAGPLGSRAAATRLSPTPQWSRYHHATFRRKVGPRRGAALIRVWVRRHRTSQSA